MNQNMMNRNSMGCVNRGGMNQRNMGSFCHNHGMNENNCGHKDHDDCECPDPRANNNGCRRSGNMPEGNGCGRPNRMAENNGCCRPDNMSKGNGCGRQDRMAENNGCCRPDNMPENNGCCRPGNMPENNGCCRPGNMPENNGCCRPGNMPEGNGCGCMNQQQLMSLNKKQLLNYLNQVSFSMVDAAMFLDTHPTDREAIAYFNEMKYARKCALKIYQQKFAPLLLDGVDAECEWTWGMEPLPWENCE